MDPDGRTLLRVSHRFFASAERVYDAFLNPSKAVRFMFATPDGEMVRVEIDPRVGGKFLFTDRRNGEDIEHHGEYIELDRPRRIVFTLFVPKYSPDSDSVEIDIVTLEAGCEATITQELVPEWAAKRGQIEKGWAGILEGAEKTL